MGRADGDDRRRGVHPAGQRAGPGGTCAEILLVGTADGFANIHGPNERVLLDEFEKATIAEADLFGRLAAAYGGHS